MEKIISSRTVITMFFAMLSLILIKFESIVTENDNKKDRGEAALLFLIFIYDYIPMPGMPPPIPMPPAGGAGSSFFGKSVTKASVVKIMAATEAAF